MATLEIYPAQTLSFPSVPGEPSGPEHTKYSESRELAIAAETVSILPGGSLRGEDSVYDADGVRVDEASHAIAGTIGPERLSPDAEKIKLPGTAAVLCATHGASYYHWFYQVLPRIELLKKSGMWDEIDVFLVNEMASSFQKETLARFDFPTDQFIEAYKNDLVYQADTLIAPSATIEPPKRVSRFLRDSFIDPQETFDKKKYFISRDDGSSRLITNEDEVWQYLEGRGFTKTHLTGLGLDEQIRIFRSAESIVTTHGAGLMHLAFCDPGTTVVEMFSPNYIIGVYKNVAFNNDLRYFYLVGESAAENSGDGLAQGRYCKDDFSVPIEFLRKILDR